jgi:hypothetical protein
MESLSMQPSDHLVFQPTNPVEATATRAELHTLSTRIDDRFTAFEQRVDSRFAEFEQRTDARFAEFEQRTDARFAQFERQTDARFAQFERQTDARFAQFESRLTQFENHAELRTRELDERMEVRFGRLESSVTSIAATLSRLEEKVQHGASKAWVLGGVTTVLLSVIGAGWWLTQQYLPAALKAAAGVSA